MAETFLLPGRNVRRQAQDSLAMWRENNIDVVECVKCGHQMREGR